MNLTRLAALSCLLAAAACSGGSSSTAPRSTPSPSASPTAVASPTSAAQTPTHVIRDLAIAEETYFTDAGTYLAYVRTVPAAFTDAEPVPATMRTGAALIGADGYCLVVFVPAQHSYVVYDSTRGGLLPATTKPADITPACVTLARKLV